MDDFVDVEDEICMTTMSTKLFSIEPRSYNSDPYRVEAGQGLARNHPCRQQYGIVDQSTYVEAITKNFPTSQ
jgi:hypothetical protein